MARCLCTRRIGRDCDLVIGKQLAKSQFLSIMYIMCQETCIEIDVSTPVLSTDTFVLPFDSSRASRQSISTHKCISQIQLDMDPPRPEAIDPYKVLNAPTNASSDEIKRAYRKAALKWHPDKAAGDADSKAKAHTRFTEVAFAYAILSDSRRRKRFDDTGRTDDAIGDDDFDWTAFYKAQWVDVVTGSAIDDFAATYKGSDEERLAVLQAYTTSKGSMTKVYNNVMLSDPATDEQPYRDMIDAAIQSGDVEAYDKFTKETQKTINARVNKAQSQAQEAQEHAEAIGAHDKLYGKKEKKDKNGDLAALISQRQKGRADAFLEGLEAKYAGTKGKKKRAVDEPSEEAFAANASRGKENSGEDGVKKTKRRKAAKS